jgi:hypothetical protein
MRWVLSGCEQNRFFLLELGLESFLIESGIPNSQTIWSVSSAKICLGCNGEPQQAEGCTCTRVRVLGDEIEVQKKRTRACMVMRTQRTKNGFNVGGALTMETLSSHFGDNQLKHAGAICSQIDIESHPFYRSVYF